MWRNIPKCVVDSCGDVIDRVTYLEQKLLDMSKLVKEHTNQLMMLSGDTKKKLSNKNEVERPATQKEMIDLSRKMQELSENVI